MSPAEKRAVERVGEESVGLLLDPAIKLLVLVVRTTARIAREAIR